MYIVHGKRKKALVKVSKGWIKPNPATRFNVGVDFNYLYNEGYNLGRRRVADTGHFYTLAFLPSAFLFALYMR